MHAVGLCGCAGDAAPLLDLSLQILCPQPGAWNCSARGLHSLADVHNAHTQSPPRIEKHSFAEIAILTVASLQHRETPTADVQSDKVSHPGMSL